MTEKRVVNRVQAVTIMTCHCINIPQVSHKNENKWSLITYLSVWCVLKKGWSNVHRLEHNFRNFRTVYWTFVRILVSFVCPPLDSSNFLAPLYLYRIPTVIYRV